MKTENNNKKRRGNLWDQVLENNPRYRRALEAHLAEKRRKREVLDDDLTENGVIHSVHFSDAENRLYEYVLQQRDIEGLSSLKRVNERIAEFIDGLTAENDGPEEVERQLKEYRRTGRNFPINIPEDWN